jgi:hypothetical protein
MSVIPMEKRPKLTFTTSTRSRPQSHSSEAVAGDKAEGERIFVSARIPPTLFRMVKGYAGTNGRKVQEVVEEALTEYLANRR